jgi:hypothetical protein
MGAKRSVPRVREFVELLGGAIDQYNAERPHRSLGGDPPLEVQRADPTEPVWIDPGAIALALMRRQKEGVIAKDGIEFLGINYFERAMIDHIGETVEFGWLEQRPDYIEVFDPNHGGSEPRWLCRAVPLAQATKAMAGAVDTARRHAIEWLGSIERDAGRIRDERLAAFRAARPVDPGVDETPTPATSRRPRRAPEPARRADTKRRLDELKQNGPYAR